MALKYELSTLDELDATLHDYYAATADGSKYVLNVEGVKPQDEFNKVYGALEKERNDLKQLKQKLNAFGDLEPDSVKSQLARIQELEELAKGSAIDDAKLDSMVNARLQAKISPVEAEKKALAEKLSEYESKLKELELKDRQRRMSDEFNAQIKAAKIDPRFEETVMLKAERLFVENDEGKFLTKEDYLPFDVWLQQQQATSSYWWGETTGGGSKGSQGGFRGENPFVTGNYTKQAELFAQNPTLATKLAEAAGIKL
jgi:Skp family chaperone for outer membrane proteins